MFARFGRRLTYANAVATLALVVALGGGAFAAASSIPGAGGVVQACYRTHHGNLRVVASAAKCRKGEKALSFNTAGVQGPAGAPGAAGALGPPGPAGPVPSVLPRGVTLRGEWIGASSSPGTVYGSISFGFTFASPPIFVYAGNPAPAGCTGGTSANPVAAPGYLCVYSYGTEFANTTGATGYGSPTVGGAGFMVSSISNSTGFGDDGTWAATSP